MRNPFKAARTLADRLYEQGRASETILINQGRLLAHQNARGDFAELRKAEFKIFSQWGEDGIIQYILSRIGPVSETFIEFGVEDFSESNCRFLMMKDFWAGFVIDGSQRNVDSIRRQSFYWMHDIHAECAFITRENVAELLARSGFDRSCGILSIDVDGIDYHLYEALGDWRPALLIVEYNAMFGPRATVSVPYDPAFVRHQKHHSGLYWGASLGAFQHLAAARGYSLVGVNSPSTNAFFVRDDLLWSPGAARSVEDVHRYPSFRDARNEQGELSFPTLAERRRLIADLPLVDVRSGATGTVASLSDTLPN